MSDGDTLTLTFPPVPAYVGTARLFFETPWTSNPSEDPNLHLMDFTLDEEQKEIRDWVRTFVRKEIVPLEPTTISRRYRTGAVTIGPQMAVDAPKAVEDRAPTTAAPGEAPSTPWWIHCESISPAIELFCPPGISVAADRRHFDEVRDAAEDIVRDVLREVGYGSGALDVDPGARGVLAREHTRRAAEASREPADGGRDRLREERAQHRHTHEHHHQVIG